MVDDEAHPAVVIRPRTITATAQGGRDFIRRDSHPGVSAMQRIRARSRPVPRAIMPLSRHSATMPLSVLPHAHAVGATTAMRAHV
jgi:hypothetical protein